MRWRALALLAFMVGASVLSPAARKDVASAHLGDRPSQTVTHMLGQLIDIGGYRLYLICAGTGSPTVILEAGSGAAHDTWQPVFYSLSHITRVCAYDRGSEGNSDRSPLSRTSQNIVAELHALLTRARVPGPYVLVGDSLGGMYVRLYAYTYLRSIAGMVLVDSSSENQMQGRFAQLIQLTVPASCQPSDTGCLEIQAFPQDAAEAGAALKRLGVPPLGNLPLIVLTAIGDTDPRISAAQNYQIQLAWQSLQQDMAHLSSNSKQVTLDTGHAIQWDDPGAVITAVQQVVAAARSSRAL